MCKPRHLVMLTVVVTCGIGTAFSVDRDHRRIARMGPPQGPAEFAGSPRGPIVPAAPLDDIRKAERSRRAVRPAGDPKRDDGLNDEGVWKGWEGGTSRPRPAEPMPPTYCRSIECAPKHTRRTAGLYGVHISTLHLFESSSGFGDWRMEIFTNDRGGSVASPAIDRVELVSLLTDDEPSVYVLDEMATPSVVRHAKRRPLDEFERLGLEALRRGEELVWTREAPTRMFGAIYAKAVCVYCHASAGEGDLLGAFTYYLKVPVDRLNVGLPEPDPATKLLLDRLEARIDLRFQETPLEDVFKFITSATRRAPDDRGIPIYVDPLGLEEAEKTLATPVSFAAKGEPLRSALERLLRSLSLACTVKDGFVMVTFR